MFNLSKGIGKFLLGALGVIAGLATNNPQAIMSVVPQNWLSITIGGLLVEGIDFLHNKLFKKE